jgi:hypothetical protein
LALNTLFGVLVSAKFAPRSFQTAGPYQPFEDDDENEYEDDPFETKSDEPPH